MNTEKIDDHITGTEKPGRPAELGEKLALWGILAIILYLVFIDK